jgi:hypothetical protein
MLANRIRSGVDIRDRADFFLAYGLMTDLLCEAVFSDGPKILSTSQQGRIDMADDRERNQGMQQGGKDVGGGGGGQQAPGKNPPDDRSAGGGQQGDQQKQPGQGGQQQGGQQNQPGQQGGGQKEGGQNEETRR